MKVTSILSLTLLLISFHNCSAQQHNIKQLLDKIDKAVNNVIEGQFILHDNYYKISVGEDSTKRNSYSKCFFRKTPSDSLTGYQLASFRNDGYEQVYDGNALMVLTPWNETLEVTDKLKYPNKIKELNRNYTIFPFFKYLNKNIQFFNKDTMLSKVVVLGIELFKGEECYKIQTGTPFNTDKNKTESFIYVSATSFLPIRQFVRFETFIGQAKEIQTFDYWTSDFKSGAILKGQFSKEILSAYSKEKLFSPFNEKNKSQLLPIGTRAPDWELPLLLGSSLKLTDLKGKIIILDFWYKACAPCQKQMIALQKLHDKFAKNSIYFVGINTIDDPIKDKLELFLKNRNITMTSVYNGRLIENLYNVYASPALFVIDKEGNIVFTIDGYSSTLLEDVSNAIKKLL